MRPIMSRVIALSLTLAALPDFGIAAPVPGGSTVTVTDRSTFIPYRKHAPLPGKAVGVLVADVAPVLATEGRAGPADQMCFGSGGHSYRWVYVPADRNPTIGRVVVPIGPEGKRKLFENMSMASPDAVKRWDINSRFALVEVEVNGGQGSPADDSFVATSMRRLDGTKDIPLKVDDVIADLRKRYDDYLREKGSAIDEGLNEAARKAIGDRPTTGPREKSELMFVTWIPEAERLRVSFRSQITDGAYQYANDIRIELSPARPAADRPTTQPPPRLPNGLRYGKQFRLELGAAYEVSKTGKVVKTMILPIATSVGEVPKPSAIGPQATGVTGVMTTRAVRP